MMDMPEGLDCLRRREGSTEVCRGCLKVIACGAQGCCCRSRAGRYPRHGFSCCLISQDVPSLRMTTFEPGGIGTAPRAAYAKSFGRLGWPYAMISERRRTHREIDPPVPEAARLSRRLDVSRPNFPS